MLSFFYITLEEGNVSFDFDQFFLALSSFERGLSQLLGCKACSEMFIRSIATSWMALAANKGSIEKVDKISLKQFFDFCTNRQHIVRRLLEGSAVVGSDENEISGAGKIASTDGIPSSVGHSLQPAVSSKSKVGLDSSPAIGLDDPTGGDEW